MLPFEFVCHFSKKLVASFKVVAEYFSNLDRETRKRNRSIPEPVKKRLPPFPKWLTLRWQKNLWCTQSTLGVSLWESPCFLDGEKDDNQYSWICTYKYYKHLVNTKQGNREMCRQVYFPCANGMTHLGTPHLANSHFSRTSFERGPNVGVGPRLVVGPDLGVGPI